MINLKTNHEIELMAHAGQVLEGVVEELKGAIRPGVRTIELDRLAERRMRAAGARPGFLGYHGFPNSICVSINDEAVHGIPGRRRILDGDIVSLDLGLVLDGFWADMGCTVAVGKVSSEAERLIQVTEECLDVAVRHAQPGGHLGDISAAVQQHAEAAGFSVIRQFVGHGIGRQMHEDPQVPNFGRHRSRAAAGDDPGHRADGEPGLTGRLHQAGRLDGVHVRRLTVRLFRAHRGDHARRSANPHAIRRSQ